MINKYINRQPGCGQSRLGQYSGHTPLNAISEVGKRQCDIFLAVKPLKMLVTITKSNNICFVPYYSTLLRGKINLFELNLTNTHFNHELQVHTE